MSYEKAKNRKMQNRHSAINLAMKNYQPLCMPIIRTSQDCFICIKVWTLKHIFL